MGKTFKSAGQNATAMIDTATSFNLLASVIEPFKPILDVLGSLFQALISGITVGLMPALRPILERLVDLVPVLLEIGIAAGQFIGDLITYIALLVDNETALLLVAAAITVITAAFISLAVPLVLIQDVIDWLVETFILFAFVVAMLIDVITFGAAGAVEALLRSLATGEGGAEAPEPPDRVGGIQEFQEGTPLITRGGLVIVHAGEGIKPAGQVGQSERLLEELIEETRLMRKEKRFRNAFRR